MTFSGFMALPAMVRIGRSIIEIGLVVLCAVLLARFIWLIIAPSAAISTGSLVVASAPAGKFQTATLSDLSILANRNPFSERHDSVEDGSAGATISEAALDAPETSLNLELRGVRSTGTVTGSAIIVLPSGDEAVFRIADEVMPNVTLDRVLADRILLNKSGVLESLFLRDPELTSLSQVGDRARHQASFADLAALDATQTRPNEAQQAARPRSKAPSQPSVQPAAFEDAGSYIVHPRALIAGVVLSQVLEGAQITGYQLRPRSGSNIMSQAGLQTGDILISVDGTSVADFDSENVVKLLLGSENLSLALNRNGRPLKLDLSLQKEGSQ